MNLSRTSSSFTVVGHVAPRGEQPQELPVVVIPGTEHFFHGRLHILKRVVSIHAGSDLPLGFAFIRKIWRDMP